MDWKSITYTFWPWLSRYLNYLSNCNPHGNYIYQSIYPAEMPLYPCYWDFPKPMILVLFVCNIHCCIVKQFLSHKLNVLHVFCSTGSNMWSWFYSLGSHGFWYFGPTCTVIGSDWRNMWHVQRGTTIKSGFPLAWVLNPRLSILQPRFIPGVITWSSCHFNGPESRPHQESNPRLDMLALSAWPVNKHPIGNKLNLILALIKTFLKKIYSHNWWKPFHQPCTTGADVKSWENSYISYKLNIPINQNSTTCPIIKFTENSKRIKTSKQKGRKYKSWKIMQTYSRFGEMLNLY